jgi:hypothetical protein
MDPQRLQDISERDQLWASLRALAPELESLASGELDDSARQQQLTVLLARIVLLELTFRAENPERT